MWNRKYWRGRKIKTYDKARDFVLRPHYTLQGWRCRGISPHWKIDGQTAWVYIQVQMGPCKEEKLMSHLQLSRRIVETCCEECSFVPSLALKIRWLSGSRDGRGRRKTICIQHRLASAYSKIIRSTDTRLGKCHSEKRVVFITRSPYKIRLSNITGSEIFR